MLTHFTFIKFRGIVTFLIIAPYKYSYLLTYLRQFHHASWQHDFAGKGEYNVLREVSKK